MIGLILKEKAKVTGNIGRGSEGWVEKDVEGNERINVKEFMKGESARKEIHGEKVERKQWLGMRLGVFKKSDEVA